MVVNMLKKCKNSLSLSLSLSLLLIFSVFSITFTACGEGGGGGGQGDNSKPITYREMVKVPGGTFTQTSGLNSSFEHTIDSFQIGQYQVTYDLWYEVREWGQRGQSNKKCI